MRSTAAIALLASAIGSASGNPVNARTPSGELCNGSAHQDQGNWYCRPVHHIIYENVGRSGQFDEVTRMDQGSGTCSKSPKGFSGPLAPFNEPVSCSLQAAIYPFVLLGD